MAEQQKRGWVWTVGDAFPPGLAGLERKSDGVATQSKRFAEALPGFADEARSIGQRFASTSRALIDLWQARKNKYKPMSPEEAKTKLEEAQSAERAWTEFVTRADVTAAVRGVNRRVNAQKREHRKQVEQQRQGVLRELDDPELRASVEGSVKQLLDVALFAAEIDCAIFTKAHGAMIRRLLLVHFVRFSYEGSARRTAMLLDTLRRQPPPTMREVASEAAINIVRDHVLSFGARGGGRMLLGPQETIESCIAAAVDGLARSVTEWTREGKTPADFGRAYFTIQDFDYSLEAQPE